MSIFGNTYGGVPSPLVFHEHPYSTRYHGMNLTVPRFDLPYRETPYAVAPYAGSPDGIGSIAGVAGGIGFGLGAVGGAVGGAILGALIGGLGYDQAGKGAAIGAGVGALALGTIYAVVGASVGGEADKEYAAVQNGQHSAIVGGVKALPSAPVAGLGGSCGCSSVSKAGGTRADLSSLGGGVFR